MKKATHPVEIAKDQLSAWRPDLPIDRIVDRLVTEYRGDGTFYTISELARELPGVSFDQLLTTLNLLAAPPFGILKAHWTLSFDYDDREDSIPVDELEAFRALAHELQLTNPYTGDPIEDPENALFLSYFAAGPLVEPTE